MRTASRGIDRVDALFDDPNLVGNAGLIPVGTLIKRLGLEALINDWVRLTGREGGSGPGRKVLTMVCAIVAGATRIDHVDILRAGGHASPTPPTMLSLPMRPTGTTRSSNSRSVT